MVGSRSHLTLFFVDRVWAIAGPSRSIGVVPVGLGWAYVRLIVSQSALLAFCRAFCRPQPSPVRDWQNQQPVSSGVMYEEAVYGRAKIVLR